MRIQKANSEGRPDTASSKGNTEKGNDRFAKILEERRKESMPQFNLPAGDPSFQLQPAAQQPESVSASASTGDY